MTWTDLFYRLWQADWSSQQIADAYGTTEERVRVLIATVFASWQ